MRWTEHDCALLKQAWTEMSGEGSVTQFDKDLAADLKCTARAVSTQRIRLGLVRLASKPTAVKVATAEIPQDALADRLLEMIEEEKKRLQSAAHRKDLKKAVHDKIRVEYTAESFLAATRRIKPPAQVVLSGATRSNPEVVTIVISDVQLGSRSHQDYIRGISKYSKTIFEQRLERFTKAVGKILVDRSKVAAIREVRVLILGDIIDGEGIFKGQPYELDQSVVDQVLGGFQALASAISAWSSIIPRIKVHAIPGNHGAVGYHASPRDNWEFILYKMMELQLQDHKTVSFDIHRSPFHIVDIEGWRFFLTHGDEIKGRNPTNAAIKHDGDWRGALHSAGEKGFDYYIFGHHHRHTQIEVNGGEILINGCWPGGSSFSVGKLGLVSRPSQLVFGVSQAEGISWRYKVDLDRFPV